MNVWAGNDALFSMPTYLDIDQRAAFFQHAYSSAPAMNNDLIKRGSKYPATLRDSKGELLDGTARRARNEIMEREIMEEMKKHFGSFCLGLMILLLQKEYNYVLVDVKPGQKTKFTLNRFRPWSAEPFGSVELFGSSK